MIDYLRHMAIFSHVAEKGSFSEAARALSIAPSRVSESMSKLEEYVGVTLLYRTTRKISLTSEGRDFYTHVSSMLRNAETGLNFLNAGKREPTGTIKISAPSYLSHSSFTKAIAKFIETYKQIHVSMSYTDLDVDPIKDGFDVCIRGGSFDNQGVTTRKLGSVERVIVAGSGYSKRLSKIKHPQELKDQDWINYRHQKRMLQFKSNTDQTTQLLIEKQARLKADNLDAVFAFAKLNLGVTVLPVGYAQRGFDEGTLVRLVEDWQLKPAQYFAVWPNTSLQDSLISMFVDFLHNYLLTSKS